MSYTDGTQQKMFEKETPPDGVISPHRVVPINVRLRKELRWIAKCPQAC